MTSMPPVKPPRGIKHSKETSGLLITVIRALSASETNEQREVEKDKLEKEYKRSDQRLDELVSLNDQDLTEVMKTFSALSERVTLARENIHAVKENLNACKQLLGCRREELMKLWLEGVEHKHVLQLLNDIDKLREVPSRLNNYLEKKLYLHATQLLVSSLYMGEGALESVEALREVRTELEIKKQQVNSTLLEELSKQLYVESTRETQLKRQGSNRDFQRGNETRSSRRNKIKRTLLDILPAFHGGQNVRRASNANSEDLNNIMEDENACNPEENSEYFLAIIIECLAVLNKIPEAVEAIKSLMQRELIKVVTRATENVRESFRNKEIIKNPLQIKIGDRYMSEFLSEGHSLLLELLQMVFDRFRLVVSAHSMALRSFSHVIKKYNLDVRLYEMTDVWRNIQEVFQLLLTDYLDIQNMVEDPLQAPSTLSEQTIDINGFFARRKPQRQKSGSLFKFESSAYPATMNSYLNEHKYSSLALVENGQSSADKKLVCEPDPKNITLIFRPIMHFIEEIEQTLGNTSGQMCSLNIFITDYVKEMYLARHHIHVATTIDTATRSPDAWSAVTAPEVMRSLGVTRPLLQSTVKVQQCVLELRSLMVALPLQGEHFCTLALNVLHNYRETCQAAYRGIVQRDGEVKRICSAAWLKDDDISRFIKSLPNWESLKSEMQSRTPPSGRRTRRQETQEEESPEEVRQRNLREAEILASNLGEGGISAHEIISDVGQLKSLALLQESIEWFCSSIRSLISELRCSRTGGDNRDNRDNTLLPAMSESLLESLEQVANEFDELANTCILVLHLEVRVQCFHYLHPKVEYDHLCSKIKDPEEADPRVEELSKVLQHMDEALQSTLHPKKTKYIFEGLGHLISKILITSAQYIGKIDENGIHRMCRNVFTLQQTLTNITMTRELALDYARQYYELFYETPEVILNNVLEHGTRFSELEYMNALQLISRSHDEYTTINKHLERLSEILGEVGVTV
ncbi:exocyst complex component 4 isoform X2 [Belonocnema kinseyi]|nr:exocyst complex component 4 isoform X2 [Belonocnema kinseyi]XP_033211208.1 exocyst complex component 4 isoform X2 [Belonocnema kinseyi]